MGETSQKLPLKEKLFYGFGDLASVLYWQTFMLYFTYFYTDVFIIPASVAAIMFLISRLWDGVNDPVMGMIADRTNTKWGKFRPYMLWLAVPYAIVGVLTFTVPNFGPSGKIIWAYTTFILIMMLYTGINIPYTALLGVISGDSNERTQVSSVKFMFAFAAGIIVSASLLPMAKGLGGGDDSIVKTSITNKTLNISEIGEGNATIVLSALDSNNQSNKLEFGFRVCPKDNNVPLLINPVPDIELQPGFNTKQVDISNVFRGNLNNSFDIKVSNDNDKVVKAEVKNDVLMIDEVGTGNAKITLSAEDPWGSQSQSFYVSVITPGDNIPVVKDSTNIFKLVKGFRKENLDLTKFITDPDGDSLKFFAESSNLKTADPVISNNLLSFLENETGIAKVNIIARDGKGGQLIYPIEIMVYDKDNNPPFVINHIDNVVKTAGFNSYSIDISNLFYKNDGGPINYKAEVINYAHGWQSSFMIYGVAFVIFFLIAFLGTKERVKPPKAQKSSVRKDLKELVTNKPWLILLATTITFILFVAAKGSVTVHYFKYVISSQKVSLPFLSAQSYDFDTLTSAYNTIGQISSLLGVLLVSWFAKRVGKKTAFLIIFIIAIFSTGVVYFFTAEQLGWIFFFQITGSLTGGPLSVLLWAMYADTADFGEWKNGRRTTGLIFSASTMSQKFGWALGAFVALNLMSQVGFQPNIAQSAESLNGLILLFTIIPAVLGILSMILMMFYPLNEKRVAEIGAELEERRKLEETGSPEPGIA